MRVHQNQELVAHLRLTGLVKIIASNSNPFLLRICNSSFPANLEHGKRIFGFKSLFIY